MHNQQRRTELWINRGVVLARLWQRLQRVLAAHGVTTIDQRANRRKQNLPWPGPERRQQSQGEVARGAGVLHWRK